MDNYGGFDLNTTSKPSRKRRSNLDRHPSSESPQDYRNSISLSSTLADRVNDAPSEGNVVHEAINWRKGLNSNECISRASYANLADAETMHGSYAEGEIFGESIDPGRSVDDNSAAASWMGLKVKDHKMSEIVVGDHHSQPLGTASEGFGTESGKKFSKFKLKVGSVTHTIYTRSTSDCSSVGTSATQSTGSDAIYPPRTLNHQGNIYKRNLSNRSMCDHLKGSL